MPGKKLSEAQVEKEDPGVIISKKFEIFEAKYNSRSKANKVLGIIERNLLYKASETILSFCNSLVRYLEHTVKFW